VSVPPYVIAGIIALLVTYAVAHEMDWVARRLGAVRAPGRRDIHTHPIPRLGGLALFAGAMLALLLVLPVDRSVALVREPRYVVLAIPYQQLPRPLLGLLAGAAAITLLGAIDDLRPLPGRMKFPLIDAASAVPVFFGMTTQFITNPFTGASVALGAAGGVATVIWLGSLAIAMNEIDGVDGLAAGVAAITAATLLSAGAARGEAAMMTVAAAVAGASLGFLRHNFNPARMFMGDSGAMLLGYLLGAAAVQGLFKTVTALSLIIPLLALAVPIVDTGFAIVRRYRTRVSIFLPDRGHLHHRLLDRGLTQRQTVLVLYLLSALLGLGGLAVGGINRTPSLIILAVIVLALAGVAWRLGLLRLRPPQGPAQHADLP
jgi:UDP-GlcNAc:undecaprenyl-phosphate/decaprenyl-phosphate GlcNAc-1-phosphate transferase